MPRFPSLLLAASLLSLNASAFAQPSADAPRRMQPPETRTELKAALEARFDQMDVNHDGKLDEKDAEARRAEHIAKMFDKIDTNHDGSISKAEFAAAGEHHGEGMGRPDGPPRAMLFHRGGPDGERLKMHGPLPFSPPPGGEMRHRFAAGGPDGKPREPITKAEFVDRGLARFDKIDTNHDGTISQAERDAARAERHGMHHHRDMKDMPAGPQATPSKPGQ